MIWGPNTRASKKLCQPERVNATKDRFFISVTMRSTYLSAILTRSHSNGEMSLGAYGEVLPQWTLDGDVFQSRVLSGNVLEKFGWRVMVGLYDHQLLVWPGLVHKTLPELRMKARVTTETRPRTSARACPSCFQGIPLIPSNSISNGVFVGATLWHTGFTICTGCTGCTRVIGSATKDVSADVFWIGSSWCSYTTGLVSSHLNFIQTKTMTTCLGSYEEPKPEVWGGFHLKLLQCSNCSASQCVFVSPLGFEPLWPLHAVQSSNIQAKVSISLISPLINTASSNL